MTRAQVINSLIQKYDAQITDAESAVVETAVQKLAIAQLVDAAFSGGGGGTTIATVSDGIDASVDIGTIVTRLTTIQNSLSTAFKPVVKELTAATQTRAANTTAYAIGDSYGGRGEFASVGTIGQSLFINDFQVIIDIDAIPTGMSLSVRFFTTSADTLVTGSPVDDNALLNATIPNTATPADGYQLALSVIGDKVVGIAKNIKFITPLEATSLWFYLRCNTAFTPAVVSETLTAKASCEVY